MRTLDPNPDKDYETNARAQYALTQALNDVDLSRVINCKLVSRVISSKSVFEVWNDLDITHEGTSQVKR